MDGEEVNDPGGKVQSDVCAVLQDGQTVPVSIARPRHASAEEHQRSPMEVSVIKQKKELDYYFLYIFSIK